MYLARLQQGLKVPNSIVMRVYNGAREEFSKIADLNFKHYSDTKYNTVVDGDQEFAMAADFNPADMDIRLAVDPSQGSDIEQQQRAQIVLEEAKNQTQPILNVREAYLDWLTTMKVTDLERLAPMPSGEPDPMEQVMMANLAREAEIAEREIAVKEAELEIKRLAAMLKAQKDGADMNLQLDLTEAQITKAYSEAMYRLWEMGMAGNDPVATVQGIEDALIDGNAPPPLPSPQAPPNPNPADPGVVPMVPGAGQGLPPGTSQGL